MTANNSSSPPGLILPTVKALPAGAGNPRDAAIMMQQQNASTQQALNKSVGGRGKRHPHKRWGRGGSTGQVAVPQMSVPYPTTGGPGQNPNAIIASNSSTSMQSVENAKMDNYATQMPKTKGGSRRKRGGNPDWNWGCKSGGKSGGKTKRRSSRRKHSKKTKRCGCRHHRK